MNKKAVLFVLTFFFFFSLCAVYAQRGSAKADVVNIRFASPLPRSSDWGRALDRMASDWEKATNNQVRVIVSHDGREGDESKMISSLSSNAIQAGVFTSAGMADICPAVMNLSIPFMIKSEAELELVLKDMLPLITNRVKKDFVVLTWSRGGWIYIFSKEKVLTPDDLRKQRISTSPELRDMNTVFRTMGFQLVETDFTNMGTKLASNAINAIYIIPASVAPLGLHKNLSHMLNVPIAPILGAIVMNSVTWNKISPANQQEIIKATSKIAVEFDASVAKTEANAIAAMGNDGLSVNKPNQAQQDMWSNEIKNTVPSLVGSIFDRDLFNRLNSILEKARSGK
ncbi:TRAP transporter substrate-binding protein DctP [Treponema sp. R80B11-R83G3]